MDDLWATKSEGVGLIVRAIIVSKIFNLCGHDPPMSQTDRQMDRQTICDSKTALCTVVHRAVIKTIKSCFTVVFRVRSAAWLAGDSSQHEVLFKTSATKLLITIASFLQLRYDTIVGYL